MSIAAMKQALDALEAHADIGINSDKAITALRQAIAEAEKQEPVAWMTHTNDLMPLFHVDRKSALNWETQPTPLYPAPPKREWVGLTDEEIDKTEWEPSYGNPMTLAEGLQLFARTVEAKLKEKNT
jgi:hypothetical protein